jgi:hypothetical protein
MQSHSFHFNPHGSSMSHAGRGLLLIVLGLAFFRGPAIPAAGEPVTPINPPLTDVERNQKSGFCRRLFLGRSGRDEREFGVRWRDAGPAMSKSAPAGRGTPNRSRSPLIQS